MHDTAINYIEKLLADSETIKSQRKFKQILEYERKHIPDWIIGNKWIEFKNVTI